MIGSPDRAADPGGEHDELDLLGIGFGPSNLALAIAATEQARLDPAAALRVGFLERQPTFGWHRGMLLDDATMQISFLKDLVTPRNPSSDFSFVTYLHRSGRLTDFINHKTLFPLRIEFHGYLEWAAARLDDLVTYGRTVVDVQPVTRDGEVVAFDVTSRDGDGAAHVQRARDLVVATGLRPSLPPGVAPGPRIWHNLDILSRVEALPPTPEPRCFVVVGAGQSAAEVVDCLHRRFTSADVHSVFARWGYTQSDDTPYANRIFDPEAVDVYFGADERVKRLLFDYHRNTNYSVVDADLINDLYRREYQERVQGRPRLRMMNASAVASAVPTAGGDAVDVVVEHLPSGERTRLVADAVVYATGYVPADPASVLGGAADLLVRRADGAPEVERDYRLVLDAPSAAAVYLQGATEHTHGIASTLLSNVAVRAGEIVESIALRRDKAERPPEPAVAASVS